MCKNYKAWRDEEYPLPIAECAYYGDGSGQCDCHYLNDDGNYVEGPYYQQKCPWAGRKPVDLVHKEDKHEGEP